MDTKVTGPYAAAVGLDNIKPDQFEMWLGERPKWLQTAAHRLIVTKAPLTEKDLLELTELSIQEGAGSSIVFSSVIPGSLGSAAARPKLHIHGLAEVRGVNKIKDLASLEFGPGNLSVVYGENGSGKSGFSRILKQACGSRAKEEIHPNVYAAAGGDAAAVISISVDGKQGSLEWKLSKGALPPLRDVHVFDSLIASNYIGAPNEAQYEPSRMRFVTQLIKTCGGVAERLKARRVGLTKNLPIFPLELLQTAGGKWLNSLKPTMTLAEVEAGCQFTQADDVQRIAGESALSEKNPALRLAAAKQEKAALAQVLTTLNDLKIGLSKENLGAFIEAKGQADQKRQIANEAAAKMFAKAPLDGVGQATWMALWEQAEKFSLSHAYPGLDFPNIAPEARCVLCQQVFDADGRERTSHFSQFVLGGLEKNARSAENTFGEKKKSVPLLPNVKDWSVQASVLKLDEQASLALRDAIEARLTALNVALVPEALPLIDWTHIDASHTKISTALDAEIALLSDLQADDKRKKLEEIVAQLKAAQWLSQNKEAIGQELARLKSIKAIEKAETLTGSGPLTKKHTELAEDELRKGYQDRFANELLSLGGKRIPVKPESKQQGKGKITFGLALQGLAKNLTADSILSEGEARIVALAAFLADISGADHGSPFIFDDPISSLDQGFEERVVARLVALSRTRQVIIFTHRLSLLALIESEVGKLNGDAEMLKGPTFKAHVRSVRSFGLYAGISQEMSIRDMKPKTAINRIRQDVVALRKLFTEGEAETFDVRAKAHCSDLRILIERCIESVLLNDVLVRFRRDVQTKGRLAKLAKINFEDCALLDSMMTRYSVFEHSQADELPALKPDIDEIEVDVKRLGEWIEEFAVR